VKPCSWNVPLRSFIEVETRCLQFSVTKQNSAIAVTSCLKGNLFYVMYIFGIVNWGLNLIPCHHDMARPQVADGGDALQVWRKAANILNKQSRTADSRGVVIQLGGWAWG
jgi:hypothetical protein